MKEKVQGSLTQEERAASCKLSIGLPGPYIVVAIPCGRHAWAAHYPRFHLQCHSPAKSFGGEKKELFYVACCNFAPHSGQKRALFSTGSEHCGQNRSGNGSLEPQSWQNFPGGPIRRQVGHITALGKPGVLKPAIAAEVNGC